MLKMISLVPSLWCVPETIFQLSPKHFVISSPYKCL